MRLGALSGLAAQGAPFDGREHEDPGSGLRRWTGWLDPWVVDRGRVVSSNAFRRLQYKTQVFLTGSGDHYRTRLTHSLEVAENARALCGVLGLNALLGECIALAHDLGHPPFGHAGERVLDRFAREEGLAGFEHNRQSLRVVRLLEHPYPPFRGLNLTQAVREGLAGHSSPFDDPGRLDRARPAGAGAGAGVEAWAGSGVAGAMGRAAGLEGGPAGVRFGLEAQVVNLADQITYLVHDLEDAWLMGLVQTVPVWPPLASWNEILPESWRSGLGGQGTGRSVRVRRPVCEAWQDQLLADVAAETVRRCRSAGLQRAEEAATCGQELVNFSTSMQAAVDRWREFNLERIVRSPAVAQREAKAELIVEHLLRQFSAKPSLLPERFVRRIESQGRATVVMDYVAGMTDRFATETFEGL